MLPSVTQIVPAWAAGEETAASRQAASDAAIAKPLVLVAQDPICLYMQESITVKV